MQITATIMGMHCTSCASGIETFLRTQDEITAASVDYGSEQLTIEHAETLDLDALWGQIDRIGYQVEVEE